MLAEMSRSIWTRGWFPILPMFKAHWSGGGNLPEHSDAAGHSSDSCSPQQKMTTLQKRRSHYGT